MKPGPSWDKVSLSCCLYGTDGPAMTYGFHLRWALSAAPHPFLGPPGHPLLCPPSQPKGLPSLKASWTLHLPPATYLFSSHSQAPQKASHPSCVTRPYVSSHTSLLTTLLPLLCPSDPSSTRSLRGFLATSPVFKTLQGRPPLQETQPLTCLPSCCSPQPTLASCPHYLDFLPRPEFSHLQAFVYVGPLPGALFPGSAWKAQISPPLRGLLTPGRASQALPPGRGLPSVRTQAILHYPSLFTCLPPLPG